MGRGAEGHDVARAEADRWLQHAGVAVVPGAILGGAGEGYLRLALVPTREECRTALSRIARVFGGRTHTGTERKRS